MNESKISPSARILVVDDDREIRLTVLDWYSNHFADEVILLEAETCAQMLDVLQKQAIDLILLDVNLPDGNGIALLDEIKRLEEAPEVLMITANASIENAVEAMRRGAWDYVPKDLWSQYDLELKVRRAIEHHRLKRENTLWRTSQLSTTTVVGNSDKLRQCLSACNQLADTDHRVLILGETGTGKEVLARYIHATSRRAQGPFIAIDCTNLPETLAESELFGHEKGAFTGASNSKPGKVEMANGGTLFLDEIGEAPLPIQAKLLRFLETNQYQRVGGTKDRVADVRIIAATNRNLAGEVKRKTFREDLFYRLKVVQIVLPPLRDRKEDIPELARHFLSNTPRPDGAKIDFRISREAMTVLMQHNWPGNVRELQNVLLRASTFSEDGLIQAKDLQIDSRPAPTGIDGEDCSCHRPNNLEEVLRRCERSVILQALRQTKWNKTLAASILGKNRVTIYRRMESLNIPPRDESVEE